MALSWMPAGAGLPPLRPVGRRRCPTRGPAVGVPAAALLGDRHRLTITGNLESKGEVQIEGEVQGDIHAQRIVIGERARITGR